MKQEQDHKLEAWLASYTVADADEALLEKIIAVASAAPQTDKPLLLRFWLRVGFAAVALLGFWAGNSSLVLSSTTSASAEQISTANVVYMNQIIFGPKTWKEVSL